MANKILPLMILFISSLFLVNIPGACLAQPGDNTKISKYEHHADVERQKNYRHFF
jgi:hypothetical protein